MSLRIGKKEFNCSPGPLYPGMDVKGMAATKRAAEYSIEAMIG